MSGSRHAPGEEEVSDGLSTDAWLSSNVYVAACDDVVRAYVEGLHRLRVPDDSALTGRRNIRSGDIGLRAFAAQEQLRAWAYFWADCRLELRWLGMDIGFGIFSSQIISRAHPIRIYGVADYAVQDPHALMSFRAAACDRSRGDSTSDHVSVYGPITLVNAACELHCNVELKDADLGESSKRAHLVLKERNKQIESDRQLLACYPPPAKKHFRCPALGANRSCRQRVG